jgi:hypothetical protein
MLLDGNEHTAITVLNAEGSSASTLAAGLAASRQTSISCWSRSTSETRSNVNHKQTRNP